MKHFCAVAIFSVTTALSTQLHANDQKKKCEEAVEIDEMIKCFQERNREKTVVGDPANILFDVKRGMTASDVAKTQELIHGGR